MNNFLRPRKYERKYEKLKNREKKNTFMGNNFILLHLKHFDNVKNTMRLLKHSSDKIF